MLVGRIRVDHCIRRIADHLLDFPRNYLGSLNRFELSLRCCVCGGVNSGALKGSRLIHDPQDRYCEFLQDSENCQTLELANMKWPDTPSPGIDSNC